MHMHEPDASHIGISSQVTSNGDSDIALSFLRGVSQIISHPGASQYSSSVGSLRGGSACGLAALNCARSLLAKAAQGEHTKPEVFFKDLIAPEVITDILSVCGLWTSDLHLEVEDIHETPLFKHSLRLVTTRFGSPNVEAFEDFLLETLVPLQKSVAAVITRPPEIITCLKFLISSESYFLVFDSHPRPSHPDGAAFILSTSISEIASYLYSLFAIDPRLLSDQGMQWQVQLLGQFSAHVFVSNPHPVDPIDVILESSIRMMEMHAKLRHLESHNSFLTAENERLETRIAKKNSERVVKSLAKGHNSDRLTKEGFNDRSRTATAHCDTGSTDFTSSITDESKDDSRTSPISSRAAEKRRSTGPQVSSPIHTSPISSRAAEKRRSTGRDVSIPTHTSNISSRAAEKRRSTCPDVSTTYTSPISSRAAEKCRSAEPDVSNPTHTLPISSRASEKRRSAEPDIVTRPSYSNAVAGPSRLARGESSTVDTDFWISDEWIASWAPDLVQATTSTRSDRTQQQQKTDSRQQPTPEETLTNVGDRSAQSPNALDLVQLQHKFDEEDTQLRSERHQLINIVQRTFDCGICLRTSPKGDAERVNGCPHEFCGQCVKTRIMAETQSPTPCPLCNAAQSTLDSTVLARHHTEQVGLNPDDNELWQELEPAVVSFSLIRRNFNKATTQIRRVLDAATISSKNETTKHIEPGINRTRRPPVRSTRSHANAIAGPSHLSREELSTANTEFWVHDANSHCNDGTKQHRVSDGPWQPYKTTQHASFPQEPTSTDLHESYKQSSLHNILDPAELQREFDEEDRRLRSERHQVMNFVQRTFDCGVCLRTFPKEDAILVNACPHEFCRQCTEVHIPVNILSPNPCLLCNKVLPTMESTVITNRNTKQVGSDEGELWQELEPAAISFRIIHQKFDEAIARSEDGTTQHAPSRRQSTSADPPSGDTNAKSASIHHIAKLQQMFNEEDQRLRSERHHLMTLVRPTFDCGICLETFAEDYVARVDACSHEFCRQCLMTHIRMKLKERRFPILCPLCNTAPSTQEPTAITNLLAQQVGLTTEEHVMWQELELSEISVLLTCRKCQRTAFVDRKELDEASEIACPLQGCNHLWCKHCQQSLEYGQAHSCDGTLELERLARDQGWKYCPGCKTPVDKISGCHHMTCLAPGCNSHFCYKCGAMIIQSTSGTAVRAAVEGHYRVGCVLFEYDE